MHNRLEFVWCAIRLIFLQFYRPEIDISHTISGWRYTNRSSESNSIARELYYLTFCGYIRVCARREVRLEENLNHESRFISSAPSLVIRAIQSKWCQWDIQAATICSHRKCITFRHHRVPRPADRIHCQRTNRTPTRHQQRWYVARTCKNAIYWYV